MDQAEAWWDNEKHAGELPSEGIFLIHHCLGYGFPVNFEFPPLPGKPPSVCLATKFA